MNQRRYVVDASVAIKWFLPEIHSNFAQRLLDDAVQAASATLLVPDLVFSEIGNILWKRVRLITSSDTLSEEEAQTILQALQKLPLHVSPSFPLILSALEIAFRTQSTVYDSLYLSLAVRENAVMITADEKFYNKIKNTPLSSYLLWVEDI